MDRMTSMATFVKVVESGGFSAAAGTLSMSPSMVTAHVQAIEERLGVRLLNRSTRRVSLTEVGHAYYERCLQILADADDADQVAQALQSSPRGLCASTRDCDPAVPRAGDSGIRRALSRHLDQHDHDRSHDRPGGGGFRPCRSQYVGAGFVAHRAACRDLPAGRGRRARLSRGAGNAARAGRPRAPQLPDLFPFRLGNEWRFAGPDGELAIPVTGNLHANSDNALRLAAVHGQGLAMAPVLLIDEIKSGRLVPVLTEFLAAEHAINAIYPHRRHLVRRRCAASSICWRSALTTIPPGPIRAGPAWGRLGGAEPDAEAA